MHRKHACQIYLKAKRDLAITREEIPQLRLLSERVQKETNMHLVPAEGAASVEVASSGIIDTEITVRVVDPTSREVLPDGGVGELWVAGDGHRNQMPQQHVNAHAGLKSAGGEQAPKL